MSVEAAANRAYKKIVNAWCMYDWANSAFATTIMAAVLPTFYASVAASHLPGNVASAYWGYTSSLALLIAAFLNPVLGAMADHSGSKKKYLAFFTALGIVFTVLLFTVREGAWLLCSALYLVAEIGFSGAIVFYDSLLPHVAKPEDMDQVSTKGYALGYLGGGLLLAINLGMIMSPATFFLPSTDVAVRLSFVSVGLWWAIFSAPLFRRVAEPPAAPIAGEPANPVRAGFARLQHTLKDIRRYRELSKFLVAFWIYNDGIGTIIKMATIYGSEIGIGQTDLIGALLLTQFVGIPFSLAFGQLAKRLGRKPSIYLALGVYTLISIGGYFMSEAWHFWVLAGMVRLVQGGSQALSRSMYGAMAPKAKTGEFFGFYDMSSKFAGIVGPLVFGLVGQLTGSSRLSIVSIVIFFIVGGLLLTTVNEQDGIRVAQEENAAALLQS